MSRILGLDIGGANIKAAILNIQDGGIQSEFARVYYPFWKEPLTGLPQQLQKLVKQSREKIDAVAVTITAELSDVFDLKEDGIRSVTKAVEEAFPKAPVKVLTTEGQLVSTDIACDQPLTVAAANWMATGWLVAQKVRTAVIIDTGSTSTSIIPVLDGKVVAQGKTDLEKLQVGELVYTGVLRTTLPAIVSSVPVNGIDTRVSSEWFAQTGDIHLILGHIQPEAYSVETPDARPRTRPAALSRLAKVVCADRTMLSETKLNAIAGYIYNKQIDQIAQGIRQVCKHVETLASLEPPDFQYIAAGLGRKFLCAVAAEKAGITQGQLIDQLFDDNVAYSTPAYGVALMLATSLREVVK